MGNNVSGVVSIFCPLLGVLICTGMGFAPYPALIEARKKKQLGDINPIPFAMMINSQFGWTLYGVAKRDYWIFFSSWPPLLMACILCSTAVHLLEREGHSDHENMIRLRVEFIIFASMCLWLFLGLITGIVMPIEQRETANTVIGSFCCIGSLVFYAAPLLNMAEIIKTKDSSSLYPPALVINFSNSLLWFSYGFFAIYSPIVWLPNMISMLIISVEIVMCIIYRPHAHTKEVERLQSMKESSVFPPTSQFSDMSDQQLKEYQQQEQQLDEQQQQQQQQQEQVTGSGRALDGDENVPLMTWAVFHNSRKMSDAPSYLISRARASTVTRGARASTLNSANTLPPPSRSVSSSLFALSPTIDDDVLPAGEDDFDVIGNPMLSTSNRNRSGGGGGGSDEDLPGTARRSITA